MLATLATSHATQKCVIFRPIRDDVDCLEHLGICFQPKSEYLERGERKPRRAER